jgi:hypothetical protein
VLGRLLLNRPLQSIPSITAIFVLLLVSTTMAAFTSPAIREWISGFRTPASPTNDNRPSR